MKYNIAIVEDNIQSSETLKSYLDRFSKENKQEFNIYSFQDGDEITSDYEAKYDIIFLDIGDKNRFIYEVYKAKANQDKKYIFGGRLSTYQYLDMHHVVLTALNAVDAEIERIKINK